MFETIKEFEDYIFPLKQKNSFRKQNMGNWIA